MQYEVEIRGITPIIMHNADASFDRRSPQKLEIAQLTAKRGNNKTIADEERIAELECQLAIWYNSEGNPTIPIEAIRSCIESAARKRKQGPLVRGGMLVIHSDLVYDTDKYGTTVADLGIKTQFRKTVVVQRSRIMRTRAKFDDWSCVFTLDVDPDMIDDNLIRDWIQLGGRQIGLGDWRPDKSGIYGRFVMEKIDETTDVMNEA